MLLEALCKSSLWGCITKPTTARLSVQKGGKKLLLIMKLTAILLLIACIQVSAKGFSQGITISERNAPLEKVFNLIEKQTGYTFFYKMELLQNAKKVDINVNNGSLSSVLQLLFKDQPFSYNIVDRNIVVSKKDPSTSSGLPNDQVTGLNPSPLLEITGRVMTIEGEPLAGASIIIKRTGKGDIANASGQFKLKDVTADDEITVSFTGYKPQTLKIGTVTNVILVLEVANNELDRLVVQAYGKTTQRFSAGNIAKVTAQEIEKQPVMNPLLALQGRVAGLDINQSSGYLSAPIKVELRGRTSIAGFPSDPMYVIDGVPLTVLDVSGELTSVNGGTVSRGFTQTGYGFAGPSNGQSPLFSLNPEDIESIEVLKDADATAIYGSRAANGVILITTKKGKAGKTKFDLGIQEGVTKVTRFWPLLNTSQYIAARREAFKNDNIDYTDPANAGQAYDLLQWDTTRNTDWQKELYGSMGHTTDIHASLSGGDAHTNFRVGAGYNRITNITTVNGADQRGSVSFNTTHRSIDQKLSISLTGGYTYSQSDMINLPGVVIFPPDAPPIYDKNGNLNYAQWTSQASYPFAGLKQPYSVKTNFLNSNLTLNYSPLKGLRAIISLGYNNAQTNQVSLQPIASLDPASSPTGSNIFGFNSNKNWIVEPQVSYDAIFGKGEINVLVGGSIQHTYTDGAILAGGGYTDDALIRNISNAPLKDARDNYGEYRYAALFLRANYVWENKYILDLNGRRDGSSRFGPSDQFGSFGSVGAAWIFSEENWLKKHLGLLSFGKLRSSYGTTGSDAVGDYQYLTRWSSNNTYAYGNIQPLTPLQNANPYYHWQVNRKLETALDLGFFKDRVSISLAYYRNRCDNQLISFPTPALSGFTSVTANSPALVQNSGWEFILNTRIIDSKNFKWSLSFNTAANRNKLLAYPNLLQSPFAGTYKIGSPLYITWLFHSTGVDPQTGRFRFQDKNHDGTISYNFSHPGDNDDVSVFDLTPKFIGGLGSSLNYKKIQLDLYFTIKKQKGRNAIDQGNIFPGSINNFPVTQLNGHWQKPGDIATSARFTTQPDQTDINFAQSDGAYTDASYIRLSTLSLGYSLPDTWIKKVHLSGCSLFLHTNNLFVITRYKGIDPETQNFGGLPPTKTMVGGISFNF